MATRRIHYTQTMTYQITANQLIDIAAIGGDKVFDYGFENIGATGAVLYNNYPLAVGEFFSVPGYKDSYRKDLIPISFTGGTGNVILFITQIIEEVDC